MLWLVGLREHINRPLWSGSAESYMIATFKFPFNYFWVTLAEIFGGAYTVRRLLRNNLFVQFNPPQPKANLSDYDQCKNNNPCKGSVCVNLYGGSFKCECEQGYLLIICENSLKKVIKFETILNICSGYARRSHTVCEDIDECSIGNPCDSLLCVNTPGSSGYNL